MACPFLPVTPPTLVELVSAGAYAPLDAALSQIDATLRYHGSNGVGVAAVATYGTETILKAGFGPAQYNTQGGAIAPVFESTLWKLGSGEMQDPNPRA